MINSINPPILAPLYWILRLYVWGLGAFLMILALLYPFLGYGDGPLSFEEIIRITISILATISFLIPNSLRTGRIIFYLRIIIMLVAATSMINMSLRLNAGIYGPKPTVELFGAMEFGAFCAPVLLMWRRYSLDRIRAECEEVSAA